MTIPIRVCRGSLVALFSLLPGLHSQQHAVETASVRLELKEGWPSILQNRLTSERLELRPDRKSVALLWHAAPTYSAGADSVVDVPTGLKHAFRVQDGTVCETTYARAARGGDLVVQQNGRSSRAGLYGAYWSLSGIADDAVEVIVPGFSGVAFTRGRAPFSALTFSWPSGWEAGMVLLQMQKGGFLIWAEDTQMHFKKLWVQHSNRTFGLRFESDNHAPFDESRETVSFPWRVTAYRGDWRTGAGIYRRWMAETLQPVPMERRKPAWVKDIGFVAIVGLKTDVLTELAKHAAPERTLLYVPSWRRDSYDVNYPEYAGADAFGPFVEAAHALGFRVMPHVNYFGCDLKHPLYERYKGVQLRSPHNKELQWWIPPLQREKGDEPTIKFAYIHPGCSEWRSLLVSRFKGIVERYGVDALHLDQTLCIPNHAEGRVEGLTVPEGNLLLHKELREALPQVALSGEGLDEITAVHEAFAQRHAARAVDHVHGTWNEAFIDCGHPISSYLLLPYTTIYGYLGMSNPANRGTYGAWTRSYENWGVIPTYSRPSVGQSAGGPAEARILLELASEWTRLRFRPDLDSPWADDTKFRLTGDAGSSVVYRRLEGGGSACVLSVDGDSREVYRYVRGLNRYATGGDISGWVAYDSEALFGLDPDATYLYEAKPRDLTAPHVSLLPENTVVAWARRGDSKLVLSLTERDSDKWMGLADRLPDARTGVRLNGEEVALERGGTFRVADCRAGGVSKESIFAHPPWQGLPGGTTAEAGLGETFGEYEFALPAERPAFLAFGIALRDDVNGRSDGATFRVLVNGKAVFGKHWPESRWDENTVDLAAYAGQTVRLQLVTTPGPDEDVSFDWACWGEPRVALKPDKRRWPVAFAVPREAGCLFADGRSLPLPTPAREGPLHLYRLETSLPSTVGIVWAEAAKVTCPVALDRTPFSLSATVSGMSASLPMQYVGAKPGEGTSDGETRSGLVAHPPNNGRVYADFLLGLPAANTLQLSFAVALQDGSGSEACRFAVEANGSEVYSQLLTGPDGWHPATVDLSSYAGRTVLLSLIVDSEGPYSYDWARWADPVITDK